VIVNNYRRIRNQADLYRTRPPELGQEVLNNKRRILPFIQQLELNRAVPPKRLQEDQIKICRRLPRIILLNSRRNRNQAELNRKDLDLVREDLKTKT
jgi:hypothetical protein